MIHNSPSHIYHYALPFSPVSSWLPKYYSAELSQEVRVVKGTLAEWGTCSRTVSLNGCLQSLACWKNTIAVGLDLGDISILDAITGSQLAVFSGHTHMVRSLTFSLDGVFLVSGSDDETVKLWDVQTGGVVKTFSAHTHWVWSVSISPNCAIIASGTRDNTICLWNVQAGDCFCVIDAHNCPVTSVSFSPTNPKLLISASHDNTVRQWDINGCQIGSTYEGKGVTFSSDGTHFVSWGDRVATVQNFGSGVIVAELKVSGGSFLCFCFSSNGQLVAGAVDKTIYIWDITGPDPHLIETLTGHTNYVTSLIFPSSIISASYDKTVKFWKTGVSSTNPARADTTSTTPTPSSIESVSLQVRDGLAISSDWDGVVKTWDILTGLCKASFQTPTKGRTWRDAQLIEGRLIAVWYKKEKIHIWDAEKGELLQTVDAPGSYTGGVRISGDGSKVFGLIEGFIQVWSLWTGEAMGKVEVGDGFYIDPLYVDGSRIWAGSKDSPAQGWDFGISGSPPSQLPSTPPDRPHLNPIDCTQWDTGPFMMKDEVTGKVVFQLGGRHAHPRDVQWDGQYLVAGYWSGEVLILDFNHALFL